MKCPIECGSVSILRLRGGKSRKIFSFDFVYKLWLSSFKVTQKYILKWDDVMFSFSKTSLRIHYKYLNNNLHTFLNFLDHWFTRFFAPPRKFLPFPAPHIFILPRRSIPSRPSIYRTTQCYIHLRWYLLSYWTSTAQNFLIKAMTLREVCPIFTGWHFCDIFFESSQNLFPL